MQMLGRAAAAVLQAHRSLTAGVAVQQQATPALLQLVSSGLCGTHLQQAAHHSWSHQSLQHGQLADNSNGSFISSSSGSGGSRTGCLKLQLAARPLCNFLSDSFPGHTRTATTSSSSSSSSPETAALDATAAAAPTTTAGATDRDADKGEFWKPDIIEGICRRRGIKLGWKKIDFVLRMIRRSYVDDAMAQLANNPKKSAVYVMHAIANARNNAIVKGADPGKLWVAEAYVTKGQYQKRIHFMSKGYSSVKESRRSHLNVKVRQLDEADPAAAKMLRQRPRLIAPLTVRMQQGRLGRKVVLPAVQLAGAV